MALPNPASQSGMVPIGMVQYQQASFKESIANAMKGFGELSAMRMLTKSPLLRMIGGGAIAEGVDIKRRERLAAAGRDPNTGRKLTKDELYEREARKKDLGALSEIKEILQALKITENGGIVRVAVAEGGLGGGANRLFAGGDRSKQISIAPPKEGDAYTLADEERDAEKEKEDDEDQLESEERQQGFFGKLFMGMRPDRDGKGGLLALLMGVVSSIGSVIANIGGFLKDGVVGLLTTVFNATKLLGKGIIQALMPFAGILVPMLLASAAGLYIKSWIDKWTAEKEDAAKIVGAETRVQRAFEVTDTMGKKKFVSAEELGKTEQELADLALQGKTSVDVGEGRTVDPRAILMEQRLNRQTNKYEFTGVMAGGNTKEAMERLAGPLPQTTPVIGGSLEERQDQTNSLIKINSEMFNFTKRLQRDRNMLDFPEIAQGFANEWNMIILRARQLVDSQPTQVRKQRAYQALDQIANKHELFSQAFREDSITAGEATVTRFGAKGVPELNLPRFSGSDTITPLLQKTDWWRISSKIADGGKYYIPLKLFNPISNSSASTEISTPSPPSIEPQSRPTRRVGSEIGNLESSRTMPTSAPTNIVTTTNSNTNNSGGNVLMAPLNTATVASNKSGMLVNRYGIPLAGAFNFGR